MKKISILLTCFFLSTGLFAQPVSLHPGNPHYFLYRGKAMAIISSSEHYGAVLNPAFDYVHYLNTLQNDGMNYTRLFTGTYFEKEGSFGIEHNTLAPAPGMALVPWKRSNVPGAVCGGNKFDLEQWDEKYFTRLRSFVAEAGKRGVIVEVTLFSSIYDYWDIQIWNPQNNISIKEETAKKDVQTLNNGIVMKYQENVVRKIVRELNEFENVIFEIQNEPWADHAITVTQISEYINNDDFKHDGMKWLNTADIADQSSLNWQKKIASIIVDQEKQLKYKHLIAQNYCNNYFPVTDVDPNVSILNFHYAYPVVVKQNFGYKKVIGFDESGFAGSENVTYRMEAWKFIIAGGGLFNNLDYSFYAGKEDGTGINKAPGGGSLALRNQLKVLSDFIHSFNLIKMMPDYNTAVPAPGTFARVLSEPGKQYAIYLHNGPGCDLKLNVPEGNYRTEWINTLNGNVIKAEKVKHTGGVITLTSPDFSEDIALKITRQ